MKRTALVLLAVAALTAACEAPTPTEPGAPMNVPAPSMAQSAGRVVHQVSVGGPDLCESTGRPTGCDSNYSMTVLVRADGSVSGQYEDASRGNNLHIAVDCVKIVGNEAVVGGVITKGVDSGPFAAGNRVWTKVVDNGTSKQDPADQIGYTYPAGSNTCAVADLSLFPTFDVRGQVTIR